MNSILTVAKYEFLRFVKTKSFYISILVLSLLPLLLVFGLTKLDNISDFFGTASDKIGIYGLENLSGEAEKAIVFDTKESGLDSLINGDIGKLIVFAPNHIETGKCEIYTTTAQNKFAWFFGSPTDVDSLAFPTIANNEEISSRISEGYIATNIVIDDSGTARDFTQKRMALGIALMSALLFVFFFMTVSSYITDILIKDKTDKVIETILSSVSPFTFLSGRVIAACSAAILQAVLIAILIPVWLLPTTSMLIPQEATVPLDNLASSLGLPSNSAYTDIVSNLPDTSISSIILSALPNLNFPALFGILPFILVGFLLCIAVATFIGTLSPRNAIASRFTLLFLLLTLGSAFLSLIALTTPSPSLSYIPVVSIPVVISLIYAGEISFADAILSLIINLGFGVFLYYLAVKIYRMNFSAQGKSLLNIRDLIRVIKY